MSDFFEILDKRYARKLQRSSNASVTYVGRDEQGNTTSVRATVDGAGETPVGISYGTKLSVGSQIEVENIGSPSNARWVMARSMAPFAPPPRLLEPWEDIDYLGETYKPGDLIAGNVLEDNMPNLYYDSTAGQLKLRRGTSTRILLDDSGNVRFGRYEAGHANLSYNADSGSLTLNIYDDPYISLDQTKAWFSKLVQVGESAPYIEIDGENKRIKSSNYSTGLDGFYLDSDFFEVGNGKFRGSIITSVLEYQQMTATAGTLLVTKSAGTLNADFVTPGIGSNVTIYVDWPTYGQAQLFANDDYLAIKQELTNYEFFVISNSNDVANERWGYTCQQTAGSTSSTIKAGASIVDYGASGDAFISLTADGAIGHKPNISMVTHTGNMFTGLSLKMRMGNLKNEYGIGAVDTYGVGIGTYGSGASLRITDSSIQLFNNAGVSIGSWDANFTVGKTTDSHLLYTTSSGTLALKRGSSEYIRLDSSGASIQGKLLVSDSIANAANVTYSANTGFWLGFDGGTAKFRIGNPSGSYMRWTGSALELSSPTGDAYGLSGTGNQMFVQEGVSYAETQSRTYSDVRSKQYLVVKGAAYGDVGASGYNTYAYIKVVIKTDSDVTFSSPEESQVFYIRCPADIVATGWWIGFTRHVDLSTAESGAIALGNNFSVRCTIGEGLVQDGTTSLLSWGMSIYSVYQSTTADGTNASGVYHHFDGSVQSVPV